MGTHIECVKGSNVGLKGCVVKIKPFFYRIDVEGHAKAIVDWKKASKDLCQYWMLIKRGRASQISLI